MDIASLFELEAEETEDCAGEECETMSQDIKNKRERSGSNLRRGDRGGGGATLACEEQKAQGESGCG